MLRVGETRETVESCCRSSMPRLSVNLLSLATALAAVGTAAHVCTWSCFIHWNFTEFVGHANSILELSRVDTNSKDFGFLESVESKTFEDFNDIDETT
jgi:hypothetical protein